MVVIFPDVLNAWDIAENMDNNTLSYGLKNFA